MLYYTRNKTVNNFIWSRRFLWRSERFSGPMVQTAIAFRPAPKNSWIYPLHSIYALHFRAVIL